MSLRDNIWATFCNMKYKGYLFELLVSRYQKIDRSVNIFLAVASSTSIAAWAIWQTLPLLWSTIIAISQVVTTIKPYFPYSKIIKELNSRCYKMDLLNIEYERFWNKVQRAKLNDDAIEQLYYDHNKTYAEVLNFPDDLVFDTPKTIEDKANFKMKNFLKTYYTIQININN